MDGKCPVWLDKLMEKMEMLGEIKQDTECLRDGMNKNGEILRRHDARLSKVESDLRVIMDRRSLAFKAAKFLLGIFGLKI